MILPSQPWKFGPRKYDESFKRYNTLKHAPWQLTLLSASEIPYMTSQFKGFTLVRNIFSRNASHQSNGLHFMMQSRPFEHCLFDLVFHLCITYVNAFKINVCINVAKYERSLGVNK